MPMTPGQAGAGMIDGWNANIFGLDGVLRDDRVRRPLISRERNYFDTYNAAAADDKPFPAMVLLYRSLAQTGCNIIMTGVPESFREQTTTWLRTNDCFFDMLYMRPNNDHRPCVELKREWLADARDIGYRPSIAIDHTTDLMGMYRAEGLVCLLQCSIEGAY